MTSHNITSHHITSHHITSHHMTSHDITSHDIKWHDTELLEEGGYSNSGGKGRDSAQLKRQAAGQKIHSSSRAREDDKVRQDNRREVEERREKKRKSLSFPFFDMTFLLSHIRFQYLGRFECPRIRYYGWRWRKFWKVKTFFPLGILYKFWFDILILWCSGHLLK